MEMGKFSERKISQRDMEFVNLRNFSREAMMEAWRISKSMLGHVDDVNRANNEAQRAIFAERITVPRLERWKKLLNTKLLPKFGGLGEGYEFDYDDPTPANALEEQRSLRARSLSAASFVREGFDPAGVLETFDFPPIPWVGRPDASGEASEVSEESEDDSDEDEA